MVDGAQEITNAGKDVYGSNGTGFMCWPHTYRNNVPRLSALKKLNKKITAWIITRYTIFTVVLPLRGHL